MGDELQQEWEAIRQAQHEIAEEKSRLADAFMMHQELVNALEQVKKRNAELVRQISWLKQQLETVNERADKNERAASLLRQIAEYGQE